MRAKDPEKIELWLKNMSIAVKKSLKDRNQFGENNPLWNGGTLDYWHNKAWKQYGKTYCEICGIHLLMHLTIYGIRFHMHNTLNPKDYTVMSEDAWRCLCIPCHAKKDNGMIH